MVNRNIKTLIELNQKIKWISVVARNTSVLWRDLECETYIRKEGRVKELEEIEYYPSTFHLKFVRGYLYVNQEALKTLHEKLVEVINKKGLDGFVQFAELCRKYSQEYLNICRGIGSRDLNKLSNPELAYLFKLYAENHKKFGTFRSVLFCLDNILFDFLSKALEKEGQNLENINPQIPPSSHAPYLTGRLSLLQLCMKIQNDPVVKEIFTKKEPTEIKEITKSNFKEVDNGIENFIKEFGWLTYNKQLGTPLKYEDVILSLQDMIKNNFPCKKELEEIQQNTEEKIKNFNKLIFELKTEEAKQLLKIASDYLYLRTYRMDVLYIGDFYVYPLFEEIANRMDLSPQEFVFLGVDEVFHFLEKKQKPPLNKIKERIEDFAFYAINDKIYIVSGNDIDIIEGEVKKEEKREIEIPCILKGIIACRGKVKGKAKVIHDKFEADKVEEGDIIVSPMTTPEMMSAILKASGIVTDEGGILCHAAIISRELNIPCIIGTKIASQIIKDNEVIEIDAIEGAVKLVERLK